MEIATYEDKLDLLKSIRPQDCLPISWTDRAMWTDFDSANADTRGFKQSTWVYACAMKTALAIGTIPWEVERTDSQGRSEIVTDTALNAILEGPNIAFTWGDCVEYYVLHLLLTGNSIVSKVRSPSGVPVEIWPFNPSDVRPIPSRTEFIHGYEFGCWGAKPRTELRADVIHMMLPDPSNLRWGQSPLQAAMKAVDTDREAANWQKVSLQNMMIPPGVFIFDRIITKAQIKKMKEMYKGSPEPGEPGEAHGAAGAQNARDHLFIGGGPKYQQLSLTPQELDYVESRKMSANEICAVYDVPPPFVGLLDRATYSNIDTLERVWWEHRLVPFAQSIVDSFNHQLVPEYGDPTIKFRLNKSRVDALLARVKERTDIAEGMMRLGYTRNEINKTLNLGMPSDPSGDIRYVPSSLIPVGSDDDI
jgi:HK97 family phage portal protein